MGLFDKKHSVGKTIATLRKEKGWTQVELAKKLQVSDKAVSKWEKDDAFPSIEFFPVLAELFGVSIDYLMTGKVPEKEIVVISKAELCAKTDDPSLLSDINVTTKDENGKTIIDYILQYESLKVFAAICDRKDFCSLHASHDRTMRVTRFDNATLIKYALITNKTSVLDRQFIFNINFGADGIKSLRSIEEQELFKHAVHGENYACIITDDILDVIVTDERVNNDTITYLISNMKGLQCVWYTVFPYLIHRCYFHENHSLLQLLLETTIKNNEYAYSKLPFVYDNYSRSYNLHISKFGVCKENNNYAFSVAPTLVHGLVRILQSTIELALSRGDIENVEQFNKINEALKAYNNRIECYVASADEIRVAKLKKDDTVGADELAIQSALHCGVLCIDEILATNDYKLIKKAIETYPVTTYELQGAVIESAIEYLSNNNWRDLFEYAVDNGDKKLITFVLARDAVSCGKILNYRREQIGNITYPEGAKSNANHMKLRERASFGSDYKGRLAFIAACKKQILDDCALKLDMDRVTDDLDEAYFKNELTKGNFEIIIIKLCVRLEAILRGKYHYDGDFSEMLNQYCSKYGREDDGWGYDVEAGFVSYLHKLRKCRNSIVHSEKTNDTMSVDELKYCIDYICKMG